MFNKLKNKKAFTLIELIVVMAIIGVLVLLAVPKFMGHTQEAKYTKLISNTKQLENASERYYMEKNDWPRLTDVPYTSAQITAFAQKIHDSTGAIATLDPDGNYYDIDYSKLSKYISVPDDKTSYVIQNPVGNIYALENLTPVAQTRTINTRATSITLDKNTTSINSGSTLQLTATVLPTTTTNKNVTWTSNNTAIATISNTGLINGVSVGNVTITAISEDGNYIATCNVIINVAFTSQAFSYTGTYESFTVPSTGKYKLEVWGGNGMLGSGNKNQGGYSKGETILTSGQVIYVYIGGSGNKLSRPIGGWNGGGNGGDGAYAGGGGGGATDMRTVSGLWDNNSSLLSRIIVAGGGGGAGWGDDNPGAGIGGGLIGYTADTSTGVLGGGGGTQSIGGTAGNSYGRSGGLGYGGLGGQGYGKINNITQYYGSGGGGGGYYGGGGGGTLGNNPNQHEVGTGGGGGSSFIGGLQNAITNSGINADYGKAVITYVGQ